MNAPAPRRPNTPGRPAGSHTATAPAARPRRGDPARAVALDVLRAVDEQDAYANLVLPRLLRAAGLHGRDAAFATELAYGALRGRGTYDAVLAACVDRPLRDLDAVVLDALRLGAHQVLSLRVPAHAAVSETVALVRGVVGAGAGSLTNAVLRRVATRDLATWLDDVAPDPATDPTGSLAVRHSHPEWVVRALRGALLGAGRPAGELAALLDADNARPLVALAALPGLVEPAELLALGARPGRWSPRAVVLPSGDPGDLRPVAAARARVQDEGSQLAALALLAADVRDDAAGDTAWADLAAGPGGKASLLAATAAARGAHLSAVEVAPHRAELVRSALAAVTAGAPGAASVVVGDGRRVGTDQPASLDRVLVDAPCTGLGALRRRPEARWRRTPADLAALGPLQRELLASALAAVRVGGVVAYVTCSPHPAETSLVVDDVLRSRDDVERLDTPALLRAAAGRDVPDLGEGTSAQLWPHLHGTDAMFVAVLRRGRGNTPGTPRP